MSKMLNGDDFVAEGFHRIDSKALELAHPPKIRWRNETDIEYIKKVAAAMNHAAKLIQDERDQLQALCEKKEEKLEELTRAVAANNVMLQQEVTRMNLERQEWNKAAADMRNRIRELERGDNG